MKQTQPHPLSHLATLPSMKVENPFRDMLVRTLGDEATTLSPDMLSRIAHMVEQAEARARPDNGATRQSRLMHHLAVMRRADSTDGGSWADVNALPPGRGVILGQLDRRITGLHAVLTLLHAAECGRTHDDGISELGDDLSTGLMFAGRELVDGARQTMSHLHKLWLKDAPAPSPALSPAS